MNSSCSGRSGAVASRRQQGENLVNVVLPDVSAPVEAAGGLGRWRSAGWVPLCSVFLLEGHTDTALVSTLWMVER